MQQFTDTDLKQGDALVIVDVQNDFLPNGSLPVAEGDKVIPVLNRYIELFSNKGMAVYAQIDWHPPDHCSFKEYGGPWPSHCVAETHGAEFPAELNLPHNCQIIPKATRFDKEEYSAFQGGDFAKRLKDVGIIRLFVGGLATDYCVLNTVNDALNEGFEIQLLEDAVRAVDVNPGDGANALRQMQENGAVTVRLAS